MVGCFLRERRCGAALVAILAVGLCASTAAAQGQALRPRLEGAELLDALKRGGLVILMRHMSTDSFVPEAGTHDSSECGTQRNLDDRGKQEARAVGEAFEQLGIPIGEVLTSPLCRSVETGELAFGGVATDENLGVFDSFPAPEKDARGKQIRVMVNTPPLAGKNTVLVTHTGTLLYSFGLQTTPEGIAHIFRPAEFGQAIYLGRVAPNEWADFAAGPAAVGER